MVEFSVMIAVIMAVAEIIKRLDVINVKYIPIVNLAIGVLLAVFYSDLGFSEAIIDGILVGLSASGLYSCGKNVIEGIKGG